MFSRKASGDKEIRDVKRHLESLNGNYPDVQVVFSDDEQPFGEIVDVNPDWITVLWEQQFPEEEIIEWGDIQEAWYYGYRPNLLVIYLTNVEKNLFQEFYDKSRKLSKRPLLAWLDDWLDEVNSDRSIPTYIKQVLVELGQEALEIGPTGDFSEQLIMMEEFLSRSYKVRPDRIQDMSAAVEQISDYRRLF